MSVVGFLNDHWDIILAVVTFIGGKAGVEKWLGSRKERAQQVFTLAARAARAVATLIKRKVIKGDAAFVVWEQRFEELLKAAGLMPSDHLRIKALDVAFRYFDDLVYGGDMAKLDKASQEFDTAVARFEQSLNEGNLKRNLDKLEAAQKKLIEKSNADKSKTP